MILPMRLLKMVMTRGKDDEKALYDLLGNQPPFPRPPVRPHGCSRGLPPKANS